MPRQSRIDAQEPNNFIDRLGKIIEQTGTGCYVWALIPNHPHLLLSTGSTLVATVMRRLLDGHAIYFNRLHQRHSYLFQNCYKSIL